MLYYKSRYVEIYHADCRDVVPRLDDMSIQTVVTSAQMLGLDFHLEVLNLLKKPLIDRGVVFWHCLENTEEFIQRAHSDGWFLRESIPWEADGRETEAIVVLAKQKDHIWSGTQYDIPWRFPNEKRLYHICADCGLHCRPDQTIFKCSECGSPHYIYHTATFPEEMAQRCVELSSEYFHYGALLDPFAGSGTLGIVGHKLWRRTILVDNQEKSCQMAKARIRRAYAET